MSFIDDLHFDYKDGRLMVRATGRGMIEHKEESILAIAEAIDANPVKAALVDLRELVGPYTFMDRYQLGELAGRHLYKVPFAVIILEQQLDHQRIGQLVAVNRGAKMLVFSDPVAAQEWLDKNIAPTV